MPSLLKKILGVPTLKGLDLKNHAVDFSLNRLNTGVDNIRYDVYLSQDFSKAVRQIVLTILAKHAQAEDILNLNTASSHLIKDKERFKKLCQEIMLNALNQAKSENEIQIDILVQAAAAKLLIYEIRAQYDIVLERFKSAIREYEVTNKQEHAVALKKRLSIIIDEKEAIFRDAGNEIFACIAEAQRQNVNEMRQINFGDNALIPDDIFPNPMLYAEDPSDDFFIIKEYEILLGHRPEDNNKYQNLISFMQNLLLEIASKDSEDGQVCVFDPDYLLTQKSVGWLMHETNIDLLINCFQMKHQCQVLKRERVNQEEIALIKEEMNQRKKRLCFFYRQLKKNSVLKRAIAAYAMQPLYLDYCPPLVPQLICQFFVSFRDRRSLVSRMNRLRKFYGKSLSLRPLHKERRRLYLLNRRSRYAYLIRFLKDFSRYHKDRHNFNMLNEAMDKINLTTEDKIIQLSRANNRLYEFLLSHERGFEEMPIIRHVIIKADVRGSTDITHKMLSRKLNPASYFSLNFFDPITEILSDYGASKVFVEGDAFILSIFEREETPEGWYSVARACGLATKMLTIVKRCNAKNQKYGLPIIELGIGICYRDGVPTFLFDGDHRIMISSAINLADRLSGCSKPLRKQLSKNKKLPFNLYVFQSISEEMRAKTADDLSVRYNVNGIEVNAEGFKKLAQEIDLKSVKIKLGKGDSKESMRFYSGRFPFATGGYQRLVIREALIPKIDPDAQVI